MKIEIPVELDLDRIDIENVRKQLSRWEDKGKYSTHVRRILWSVDSALRKQEAS